MHLTLDPSGCPANDDDFFTFFHFIINYYRFQIYSTRAVLIPFKYSTPAVT